MRSDERGVTIAEAAELMANRRGRHRLTPNQTAGLEGEEEVSPDGSAASRRSRKGRTNEGMMSGRRRGPASNEHGTAKGTGMTTAEGLGRRLADDG